MKRFALVVVLVACASSPPPPSPPTPSAPPPAPTAEATDAGPTIAEAPDAAPLPIAYPTAPDDSDALILRRGACNGRCPIYTAGITSNGNVHFYGEQFTKTAGYAFGAIASDKLSALYKFMDAHPVSAAAKKGVRRPDSPTEFVVVHRRGTVKKMDPPGDIADEIDRVLGTAQWIGDDRPMLTAVPPLPQSAFEAMLGKQLRAFDKCATAKTEITLTLHITPDGKAQSDSAGGKKEADSTCIHKVVGTLLFPIADVNVAALTLTIGTAR